MGHRSKQQSYFNAGSASQILVCRNTQNSRIAHVPQTSFVRTASYRCFPAHNSHHLPKGTMLATVRKFARLLPPLSYPLTRDVMLPYCSLLVLILGLVLIPLLTLYAVVATGYEYITITTSNFNATRPMWYDVLNYGDWILPSISCQPSILKPGDGSSHD